MRFCDVLTVGELIDELIDALKHFDARLPVKLGVDNDEDERLYSISSVEYGQFGQTSVIEITRFDCETGYNDY